VAVCDRAETRKELIRLLGESMPGVEVEIVTFDADTADPLDEILTQAGEARNPVMVFGLERAVPMGRDDAPILRTLNLERAEWPERLRRPVVFWIPEALLGPLGRSAPDFLDWRSDTIYFPSRSGVVDSELYAFESSLWRGGLDGRMPEADRHARIAELRSRMRTTPPGEDPVVEKHRGAWLHELGNHLFFFGKLAAAEDCFRKSLAVAEKLGFRRGVASSCHHLGMVAQARESLGEAAEWCRRSLAILEEVGDDLAISASYNLLGAIAHRQSLEEAMAWYEKARAVSEELGDRVGTAMAYHNLGIIAQGRGSLEEALDLYEKSLAIMEEFGNSFMLASTVSVIGILLLTLGRLEAGVAMHVQSFALRRKLGSADLQLDVSLLRGEREVLGDERFQKLVEQHAETPEIAAAILDATAEPADKLAEEVAETPAGYKADDDLHAPADRKAGWRSDYEV
jgi:tetratricopeptide (TPR) repeat protein